MASVKPHPPRTSAHGRGGLSNSWLHRRRLVLGLVAAPVLWSRHAAAQWEVPWRHSPSVTVVGAANDARHPLCDQAIAFWNDTFAGLGQAFRLGPVSHVDQPIDEASLQAIGDFFGRIRRGLPPPPSAELLSVAGDLSIYLGRSEFVSFASHFTPDSRKVVGICSDAVPPLSLPNVALNVITHELGHAIGLGHHADPSHLMCGRPAVCRPSAFQSATPRIFALTDAERLLLRRMYGPN